MDAAHSLREALKSGRKSLADAYLNGHADAARYLAEHAALVDSILQTLWRHSPFSRELALAAVGGYGRGELFPGSDIDLLILLPKDPDAELAGHLEKLISVLWDIGLEVGHSVRTIPDCLREAKHDITVQTALLESRPLCGNTELFEKLQAAFRKNLDPAAFFNAKRLEQEERHHHYHESPYSLEPNCKESPGGLRDLHNILWCARASGCGADWQDLASRGLIGQEGLAQLKKSERYLQQLRIRLHFIARRKEDRLSFDYQTPLAEALRVKPTAARRAPEVMMQIYYRHAKQVALLNTIILQGIAVRLMPTDTPPRPINERFQIVGNLLDITHEEVFAQTPSALLEGFGILQRHPGLNGMSARALLALWRNRALINPAFRGNPTHRRLFLFLLQSPRGVVHEFRRMNQLGILERYLPAFGKIVGQMQHDLFHAYTVDQHILMTLRNLRRFTQEEFAHEYPHCSQLINAFAHPWTLYVAALFHDIAKGRGGDHSLLGMADARKFCENHAIDPEDTKLVVWLVREHLTMSHVAQKEDISDPSVIAEFARKVEDVRHLTALYLLTVADIRATGPKVWNNWKARLLEDLYKLALKHLMFREQGAKHPDPQGVIEERQAEALRTLRGFALPDTVHERLWRQLDTVYFLRHTAEEIVWHTRALHYRIWNDQPIVSARARQSGLQVMVYSRDLPDLFLRLVAFFARAGYSVADAKIHTTRHGYALDSFILLNVGGNPDDRDMLGVIEAELTRTLEQSLPVKPLTPGRLSRQARHFPIPPEVRIHADDREPSQQVLSLVAADRPGLLYTIALVLARHRISLKTARISTLGERVEDTFLIAGPDLDKTATLLRLESELLEALQVQGTPTDPARDARRQGDSPDGRSDKPRHQT